MNIWIGTGRLTRDPELTTATTGTEMCRFCMAVDRQNKKGDKKEADFVNCTAFGKTGVFVNQYFKKGDGISVTGRWESNTTEKDGKKNTYWGVAIDRVEFPIGGKKSGPEAAPTDPSGMTPVDDVECPF